MSVITQRDLLHDQHAEMAYIILNNAGRGFDPGDDISGWRLHFEANSTSSPSIYSYTDDEGDFWVVLVGTDGAGADPWAVRVGDVGVDVPPLD